MKQTQNTDRIIAILSDRIKVLEIERAYMIDEITSLRQKDDENTHNSHPTNEVK